MQVQATNIQPKENVVYTKQTQTTSSGTHHERDGETKTFYTFAFFLYVFSLFVLFYILLTILITNCWCV